MLTATLLVTPAAAAPAQRFSDTQAGIVCERLESADGTVFLAAVESDAFGEIADLTFWSAGTSPETSNPTWVSISGSADVTETAVTGTFQLVEFAQPSTPEEPPFGDPVGTATLSATLTPDGEPVPFDDRFSQGNQKFRVSGVVQNYTVTGTVELPGGLIFDLSTCDGFRATFTEFRNSPASQVSRFESFDLSCSWRIGETFISLFAVADEFGGFGQLFISTPETEVIGFEIARELSLEAFSASYELIELTEPGPGPEPPEGEPIGTAEASAVLTPTKARVNEHFSFGPEKVHVTGQLYSVDGTLSITSEIGDFTLPMDDQTCRAADQRTTQHFSARQGPRGKPLPNDFPENAEPIAVGETVRVRTRGNAIEPEAPCTIEFDGEMFDVPIGRSAWWTFEGTGGDVLIDTAGSDFDTAVGVYVDDGAGGFEQIGCVDDDQSLQAAITVATEASVTYWIQAGGAGDQGGNLILSVTPL